MTTFSDGKTEKISDIILTHHPHKLERVLVVGCGSGLEAAILAQQLGANVSGVDIAASFDSEAARFASLRFGNATSLPFADASFDFVYSYHALEHIPNAPLALREMKRVLRDGGGYWVGTPNRNRMIGYIGSKRATLGEKFRWNIADWKARLKGQFRNEAGAHAGFSSGELKALLGDVFATNQEVSDIYYKTLYGDKQWLISLLQHSHLSRIVWPSIYFMGLK